MNPQLLPALVLLFSAFLWGLAWWPIRLFAEAGLSGPALSLASYGGIGVLGLPWLLAQRARWWPHARVLMLLLLLGGLANAGFVYALMNGSVVRVMLLFYLSPVWSVLGGAVFFGERIDARRAVALLLAVGGAGVLIAGPALLAPAATLAAAMSLSDWVALGAGLAFAGGNLATRHAAGVPEASKTVAIFLGCGLVSAAMIGVGVRGDVPAWSAPVVGGLAAFALLWLLVGTATTVYGVTRLESGRAGIISIVELLTSTVSAAWLLGTPLSAPEWIGALLIGVGACIEAVGDRRGAPNGSPGACPDCTESRQ
ncbi:DMT family transporter [Derxia gummosa]|uniref:DMT family transporter n=1 Tax=Derxia gummosa DSM 723 TaxID=1121388 RepID=A0A8B6XB34_9BURK|nr:DMT family transporter [Derxia gummosa]